MASTVAAAALQEARRLLGEAAARLERGEWEASAPLVSRARALLRGVLENPLASPLQRREAKRLLELVGELDAARPRPGPGGRGRGSDGDPYLEAARRLLARPAKPLVEPVGLEEALARLEWAAALALRGDPLAPRGVLLYGPPGTGKTLLAATVAYRSRASFIEVPVHAILSKYVGDTPKMVHAVFRLARMEAPSIVFIDEVDALALDRDRDRGPALGLVQALLTEIDGLRGKAGGGGVLVVAATNKPWLLDPAFLRRLELHLYIPPPGPGARWRIILENAGALGVEIAGDVDRDWLVGATEGYTGADLARLVKEAALNMLRRLNPRPPPPGAPLAKEPVSRRDFEAALGRVKATVTPRLLRLYEVWSREMGG